MSPASSAGRGRPDDEARRAYWTQQMEAAYEFMLAARDAGVQECGEPLVPLRPAVQQAGVEVAFSDTKVAGDYDRLFYLREGLLEAFLGVAAAMNARGWVLKVEDGYRTRAIQKGLARKPSVFDLILQRTTWELRGRRPTPEELFRRLSVLVATTPKTGTHMSGSAIDVSVLNRRDGSELDRGGPYLEMSELTPMASPFVGDAAAKNRRSITALMKQHGFLAYPYEFWHYSQGDAIAELLAGSGRAGRYGAVDVDPSTGKTLPLESPTEWLNSPVDVQSEIERSLRRSTGSPSLQ